MCVAACAGARAAHATEAAKKLLPRPAPRTARMHTPCAHPRTCTPSCKLTHTTPARTHLQVARAEWVEVALAQLRRRVYLYAVPKWACALQFIGWCTVYLGRTRGGPAEGVHAGAGPAEPRTPPPPPSLVLRRSCAAGACMHVRMHAARVRIPRAQSRRLTHHRWPRYPPSRVRY